VITHRVDSHGLFSEWAQSAQKRNVSTELMRAFCFFWIELSHLHPLLDAHRIERREREELPLRHI